MMSSDAVRVAGPASKSAWRGGLGYAALLAGGVAAFLLVRHLGQGLTAPAAGPGVVVAAPSAAQVDVVAHVIATLSCQP